MRELSLLLAGGGISTHVFIKGDPGREVKEFISPKENIRNYFFPRLLFRVLMPFYFLWLVLIFRCRICIWVRERTTHLIAPYCRLFGVEQIQLIEQNTAYTLLDQSKRELSVGEIMHRLTDLR